MFLELLVVAAFLAFLQLFVLKSRADKMYKKIPGPKPYPIIGNILDFDYPKVEVTTTLKKFSYEYGPVCFLRMGPSPVILLRNPSDIEIILRSTTEIEKSAAFYWVLDPWLNQGLLTSKGDIWRKHRKIITPAFHFKILETFVPVFVKNTEILLKKLSDVVGQDHDVTRDIDLCSLDIIIETAMGIQMNAQLEDTEYVSAIREVADIATHRNFNLIQRTFIFDLLPVGKRHNKLVNYLHNFTDQVIEERKAKLTQMTDKKEDIKNDHEEIGIKKKKVFIDLLLQYNSEGAGLTDREIREEVDTFIFAGFDTTSTTISFCLYNLSQNQDVQNTAYEEICSILGDKDPTYEDLMEMKYLGKVIKESLRIHPTALFIARHISKDTELQSGYIVPADTAVMVLIEAMNHDPVAYPNPFKFDPLRFDNKPDNPYAFVPFSAGPRNCIGQKYAILEIKAVLCLILRKFRLLPSDVPITPWFTVILRSKTGIHLKLEHR